VLNTYIVRTYSSKVNTFHHVGIITTHVLLLSRRVTLLKVITKVEQHFKVICLKERISNHKRLRLFPVRSDVILDLIMLSTKGRIQSRSVSYHLGCSKWAGQSGSRALNMTKNSVQLDHLPTMLLVRFFKKKKLKKYSCIVNVFFKRKKI
jgi:hypothetical protein